MFVLQAGRAVWRRVEGWPVDLSKQTEVKSGGEKVANEGRKAERRYTPYGTVSSHFLHSLPRNHSLLEAMPRNPWLESKETFLLLCLS